MVNIFGDSIVEGGPGNLRVVKKVIITSGKCIDYYNEIVASHILGRVSIQGRYGCICILNSRIFQLTYHK